MNSDLGGLLLCSSVFRTNKVSPDHKFYFKEKGKFVQSDHYFCCYYFVLWYHHGLRATKGFLLTLLDHLPKYNNMDLMSILNVPK